MRRVRVLAIVLLATALAPGAFAEDKPLRGVALVIGESDYAGLDDLDNPKRDAPAMGDLLDQMGFDVQRVLDGDADTLREAIARFATAAKSADVALVYYSGHGIEVGGADYLVPTDSDLGSPQKAGRSLVPVSGMLDELARSVPVTIVLLDACRTNSFPEGTLVQLPGTDTPVAVEKVGLEAVRGPTPLARPDTPADTLGMVIGFAASPGRPALDGEAGGNSPYAAALLKHFAAGGYSLGDAMTLVTEEVYLKTHARQLPWVSSSLMRVLTLGTVAPAPTGDQAAISEGRRQLLLSIARAPKATRTYVETVAETEHLPLGTLWAMAGGLGKDGSNDLGKVEAQIDASAERLKTLAAMPAAPASTDPELARLAGLATTANDEGALEVALTFRVRASARADVLAASLDANAPTLSADRLQIGSTYAEHAKAAMLTVDFATAATMWGKAYDQVVGLDDDAAVTYKWQEANNLADEGRAKGDAALLNRAIDAYDVAGRVPSNSLLTQARIETSIGDTYLELGRLGTTAEPFNNALDSYDAVTGAYDEIKAEGGEVPAEAYVRVHTSMGVSMIDFAERTGDSAYLSSAKEHFELALSMVNAAADPLGFAQISGDLASVLVMIGDRTGDASYYDKGEAIDRAVIDAMPRATVPLQWATAQNNRGIALARIGESAGTRDKLDEAIEAFDLALAERTRERVPFDWASTQDNKASALASIGAMTGDADATEKAIAAFDAALEVHTREAGPVLWAQGLRNRGLAKKQLGVMTDSTDWLERAIEDYRTALEVLSPRGTPDDWGQTQVFLGLASIELGDRTGRRSDYEIGYDALVNAYDLYIDVDPDYADAIGQKLAELEEKLGG